MNGQIVFRSGTTRNIFLFSDASTHSLMRFGGASMKGLSTSATIQIRNFDDDAYGDLQVRNITHTGTISSSRREWKKNIECYTGDALNKIMTTPVREYHLNEDDDRELKRIGFIYDEVPYEMADIKGNGVELYSTTAILWKAVQELTVKVQELENQLKAS